MVKAAAYQCLQTTPRSRNKSMDYFIGTSVDAYVQSSFDARVDDKLA